MKKLIKTFLVLILLSLHIPNLLARSYDEIIQSGKIRIGVNLNVPPFGYKENGQLKGIDIEIAKLVGKKLGVEIEYVFLRGAKEREPKLMNEEVDIVIAIYSITEERLERINFSTQYYVTGLGLMVKANNFEISNYKDLADKSVGAVRKATGEKLIEELVPKANLISFRNQIELDRALEAGVVDAIIDDKVLLDYRASKKQGTYKVLERLNPDPYGIAIKKEYPKLLEKINEVINDITTLYLDSKKSQLARICDKFGIPMTVDVILPELPTPTGSLHVVQAGESLSRIAVKYYKDATKWFDIYQANKDQIKYASIIEPGMELQIPDIASGSPKEYLQEQIKFRKQKISILEQEIKELEKKFITIKN